MQVEHTREISRRNTIHQTLLRCASCEASARSMRCRTFVLASLFFLWVRNIYFSTANVASPRPDLHDIFIAHRLHIHSLSSICCRRGVSGTFRDYCLHVCSVTKQWGFRCVDCRVVVSRLPFADPIPSNRRFIFRSLLSTPYGKMSLRIHMGYWDDLEVFCCTIGGDRRSMAEKVAEARIRGFCDLDLARRLSEALLGESSFC
jgi:hypothetical protein